MKRNAPIIECTANHISLAYNLKITTIIRIYSEAQIPYNTTTSQSQKTNSLSLEQPGWLPAIVNWDQLSKLKYIQLTLKFPNTPLLFQKEKKGHVLLLVQFQFGRTDSIFPDLNE